MVSEFEPRSVYLEALEKSGIAGLIAASLAEASEPEPLASFVSILDEFSFVPALAIQMTKQEGSGILTAIPRLLDLDSKVTPSHQKILSETAYIAVELIWNLLEIDAGAKHNLGYRSIKFLSNV